MVNSLAFLSRITSIKPNFDKLLNGESIPVRSSGDIHLSNPIMLAFLCYEILCQTVINKQAQK